MTTDETSTDDPNASASAETEHPVGGEQPANAEQPAGAVTPDPASTPATDAQSSDSLESTTAPPAANDPPTPSVAEMMEAVTESADTPIPAVPPEASPPEVVDEATPAAQETDSAEPAGGSASETGGERPSDRMRGKIESTNTEVPVGSVDLQTQRPVTPTNTEPIDIPESDDLDGSLEAEIASAMGQETAAPEAPAAQSEDEQEELGPGSQIAGTVQHIHGEDIFVNAGLSADVLVGMKQFAEGKQPATGDKLDLVVESIDGDGLVRARIPEARSTNKGGNWDGLAAGQVVDCQVTGTNKGGLQVSLSNLKGFLPASQVDLGFVANMEEYVGQKLTVQITEVNPKKRNLVVSRKVLLLKEREEQQAGFWETLEVGKDYTGTVKTLKPYGAFVSLGPIDGFLHIGEISWSRIAHPNEVLNEGQQIQVRVIKVDREKNRISLGMKQLVQNPWENLSSKYPADRVVNGKVTRTADFGAFVLLEPGVEGLVHISELAWRRVGSVSDVLKVGDERDFKVLEVDPKRKRVSLSLKALEQKPESVRKAEAEDEARPVRKPNPDLRGGMGSSQEGGGLFGNPNDFT